MRVLIDADMIAHEVGHLREQVLDENGEELYEDGEKVQGAGQNGPQKIPGPNFSGGVRG